MAASQQNHKVNAAREKFLGLSLETTRKSYYPQLQEQLEAAKGNAERLQLLIDSLPARISYIDVNKRYVFANKEYEIVFGLNKDQIIGQKISTLVGEKNYANIRPHLVEAFKGKSITFETDFYPPQGEKQWHEVSFVPVTNATGEVEGMYILARDLTERKKSEDEKAKFEKKLQEIQKFKAVGTLAAGLAHDFNNLLMGIQGRSALLSLELENNRQLKEHLEAIDEYVKSATTLTNQLLGFTKGGKYQVQAVDLNEIVIKSLNLFGRTRKQLRIENKIHSKELIGEIDQHQIDQVLLNMYVNAWQAMPNGGTLFVETSESVLDEMFCVPNAIEPGRFVKISITDTGVGMDEVVRQRVFDPFFTTKETQRGTGLGLASAMGIMQHHGGTITVYSELGKGTTFTLYLPLSGKSADREADVITQLIRGTETVLLVDDENIILEVGKAMLKSLGYNILVAPNGKQALDILSKDKDHIKLVLLDLVMPGMDGGLIFDFIQTECPGLPVILCSGYSMDGQASEVMQKGCKGFIQKPFGIVELSQLVRKVLDS